MPFVNTTGALPGARKIKKVIEGWLPYSKKLGTNLTLISYNTRTNNILNLKKWEKNSFKLVKVEALILKKKRIILIRIPIIYW